MLAMLDVEESMLDAADRGARATLQRVDRACADRRGVRRPRGATAAVETGADRSASSASTTGTRWVALRLCLACGEVGCCDSSPSRHATAHFHETAHPVMQSAEPGEDWRWCYVHHLTA